MYAGHMPALSLLRTLKTLFLRLDGLAFAFAKSQKLNEIRLAKDALRRRFVSDCAGSVVLLFGLTLIPLMGFVGGAIDYANAYNTRSKLQSALDAAARAVGRKMDEGAGQDGAKATGMDVLKANLGDDFPAGYSADFDIQLDTVTATGGLNVDTYILGVLGIDHFPVAVSSTINIAAGTYEVALVLDNSGSMAGSKIADLRTAATSLTNILYANQHSSDHVMMSLVPFAASVNVGTQYANASWMDTIGRSSIHAEHFDSAVTRWDMFNALSNASWRGCVEVRPAPHDVTDTTPTAGDDNSYFVPLFAPDEPDTSGYLNSYISDEEGSCDPDTSEGDGHERQSRTCKYSGENADTSLNYGTRRGPNHMCDSQPIRPLTNNSSAIVDAIEDMNAYGGTNIHDALMWGWRTLSPAAPFDEGKPYDDSDNTKIMILMSDGANWHSSRSNHNQSWYTAYGYHTEDRLGSPSGATSALRSTMNVRTAQACTNAKTAGILIYTVALEVSDSTTIGMLRDCATSPGRFFELDDSGNLEAVFEAIANEISKLRIAD